MLEFRNVKEPVNKVADMDPVRFGPYLPVQKIFTGSVSRSESYSGYVKLYKQGQNLKKMSFYTFSGEFFYFSGKKINIKIPEEI